MIIFVGTLRKNKREVPTEFLPNRKREVGSSVYGFNDNITLASYVPKVNKSVLLISSMHHQKKADEEINKPKIVGFYNHMKRGGGVTRWIINVLTIPQTGEVDDGLYQCSTR